MPKRLHKSYTTNHLRITTPEGINLTLSLAGPPSRFLALIIDYIIIIIIFIVIKKSVSIFSLINIEFTLSFMIITQFALSWIYYIGFEWLNHGQSPGKKTLRLRVVDKRGFSLKPNQIVIRNIFRLIDSMPAFYLLGGIVCIFSSKYQRIGDMIASTVVIYDRHSYHQSIENIAPDKYNSFYSYPHLISRARQQITPRESSMLLKALLRRNILQPESRIKVYGALTDYFKSIVNFPVENISNEQYLRNLLAILYQRRRY